LFLQPTIFPYYSVFKDQIFLLRFLRFPLQQKRHSTKTAFRCQHLFFNFFSAQSLLFPANKKPLTAGERCL